MQNNPSRWSQRLWVVFFASIATLIALYMGLYQWRLIDYVWDPVFKDGTMKVLDSDLSHQITKWIHMPDAILGALAYLTDVIFALVGSTKRWIQQPYLVIIFGISVIPVGIVSSLLVFMQGTVVGSWCFLCLISATISLLLIVLAYDEVRASCVHLYKIWKKNRKFSILWKAFMGSKNG